MGSQHRDYFIQSFSDFYFHHRIICSKSTMTWEHKEVIQISRVHWSMFENHLCCPAYLVSE